MFWMITLPAQITFVLLVACVFFVTARAPAYQWNQNKTFLISSLLSLLAFIPSCAGIMFLVDEVRFGHFEYATYADIKDLRGERHLPRSATAIQMDLQANGYRAQYHISQEDLHAYLDSLWEKSGAHSTVPRQEIADATMLVPEAEIERAFGDLGWKPLQNAVRHRSPISSRGSGSAYFFDPQANIVYQRTNYW